MDPKVQESMFRTTLIKLGKVCKTQKEFGVLPSDDDTHLLRLAQALAKKRGKERHQVMMFFRSFPKTKSINEQDVLKKLSKLKTYLKIYVCLID